MTSTETTVSTLPKGQIGHPGTGGGDSWRYHKKLFRCKLCWKIALAVLFSILIIEAAILIPSYKNYERDQLRRLDKVGLATVTSGVAVLGDLDPGKLLSVGRRLNRGGHVLGGAVYDADGYFIGAFGDTPLLTPGIVSGGAPAKSRLDDGRVYEVLWPPSRTGLPYTIVGRLNSQPIKAELVAFLFRIMGLVLLISGFVCVATMAVLGKLVLRPLLELRANLIAASENPANPEDYAVAVRHNDEFGDVVERFNELLHLISRSHQSEMRRVIAMADDSLDAIVAFDGAKRMVYGNKSAIELCGFKDAEAMIRAGAPHLSIVPDSALKSLPELLANGSFSGEALVSTGAEMIPCLVSANRLLDGNGKAMLYYASLRDIQEIRDQREELQRQNLELVAANRARTEFLANISHELRTPLNAIIGFSEIMGKQLFGPLGNAKYEDYTSDIHNSGTHLLKIINDILDLSKIDAGSIELIEEVIDVTNVVKSALRLIEHRARDAEVRVVTEFADGLAWLNADQRIVKQIIMNLLSNAVKFTPPGGNFVVSAGLGGDGRLTITIADSGIGIATEDIPRALSRFGQVEGDIARRFEGTGLGLPLVKEFVELHGGTLALESTIGEGTTVIIAFPASRTVSRKITA